MRIYSHALISKIKKFNAVPLSVYALSLRKEAKDAGLHE